MTYNIIKTGSAGNAVVIDGRILVDCGVPYKALKEHLRSISLVLLTHSHTDHINKATVSRLAKDKPLLRFGCCKWMVSRLLEAGVSARKIDVYDLNREYAYGDVRVIPVPLVHNVPNCGYKIITPGGKALYCTDTNNLDGIDAMGYDLYLLEANYEDGEIQERISEKKDRGEYAYEYDVLKNHLSKEKCDAFICANAGDNSEYVYLHEHRDKEKRQCRDELHRTSPLPEAENSV